LTYGDAGAPEVPGLKGTVEVTDYNVEDRKTTIPRLLNSSNTEHISV